VGVSGDEEDSLGIRREAFRVPLRVRHVGALATLVVVAVASRNGLGFELVYVDEFVVPDTRPPPTRFAPRYTHDIFRVVLEPLYGLPWGKEVGKNDRAVHGGGQEQPRPERMDAERENGTGRGSQDFFDVERGLVRELLFTARFSGKSVQPQFS
jgi:hypothetical protein